jgi:hypothetical protein
MFFYLYYPFLQTLKPDVNETAKKTKGLFFLNVYCFVIEVPNSILSSAQMRSKVINSATFRLFCYFFFRWSTSSNQTSPLLPPIFNSWVRWEPQTTAATTPTPTIRGDFPTILNSKMTTNLKKLRRKKEKSFIFSTQRYRYV